MVCIFGATFLVGVIGVRFTNIFGTFLWRQSTFVLEVQPYLFAFTSEKFGAFFALFGHCDFNKNQFVSFWLWLRLTTLSLSNGVVYSLLIFIIYSLLFLWCSKIFILCKLTLSSRNNEIYSILLFFTYNSFIKSIVPLVY